MKIAWSVTSWHVEVYPLAYTDKRGWHHISSEAGILFWYMACTSWFSFVVVATQFRLLIAVEQVWQQGFSIPPLVA
jgi:hypothetical protein